MRKTWLLLGAVLVLCGCGGAGGRPSYPDALTSESQQVFNSAEGLYQAGRFDEADAAYKNFINSFGYNALTDDARFKRGEISFQKKNYGQALEFYRQAYANVYSPAISPRAQFKAAYSLYQLRKFDEARQEVLKISRRDASAVLRTRADSLGVLSVRAAKEPDGDAIRFYLFLLDDYTNLATNRDALQGAPDIVSEGEALSAVRKWIADDKVTSEQVAALPLKEYKGKVSGGYAQYKYGKTLSREGDFGRATKELKGYVSAYPKHDYYEAAKSLLGETAGQAGEAAVKVGLILPLSGKYGIYGESVEHGAECAAGVFSPCEGPGGAALVIRDADGDPGGITQAVDELVGANVIAIIGPMLSSTVDAAATRAQQLQVPMITLSQRPGTSDIGDYVFRNTVAADSQVGTIVDYAVGRKKLKRFLVLYPQSEQGREYKDLFADAVKQAGGRVVAAHSYASSRIEFASDIRTLDLAPNGERNFDAIFIPDAFGPAGYLATTLAMMGIEGVPLLGISRWDDSRLITAGGKYVEGAVFPEAFYKGAQDPAVQSFVSQFNSAYGIEPTLLEALGYDSMKMILDAVKNGAAHRETLKDALTRMSDFHGVTGRTSFNAKRDAVRELPLLTVSGGQIRPLK